MRFAARRRRVSPTTIGRTPSPFVRSGINFPGESQVAASWGICPDSIQIHRSSTAVSRRRSTALSHVLRQS